jgi:hypothetical protein
MSYSQGGKYHRSSKSWQAFTGLHRVTSQSLEKSQISRTARLFTDRFIVLVFRISLTEIYCGRRTFRITDCQIVRKQEHVILHTNVKINTHEYSYALNYFNSLFL